jgi:hypothetical protein
MSDNTDFAQRQILQQKAGREGPAFCVSRNGSSTCAGADCIGDRTI